MRASLALVLVLVVPVVVDAHVLVVPEQSEAGGWERYTILVPTEKESPTVRVELRLPTGIEVVAVESKPGWQGRYEPFPIGAARVEWKGGRIPSGEFLSFDFLAWNPPAPACSSGTPPSGTRTGRASAGAGPVTKIIPRRARRFSRQRDSSKRESPRGACGAPAGRFAETLTGRAELGGARIHFERRRSWPQRYWRLTRAQDRR